jgi:hypothetical protein
MRSGVRWFGAASFGIAAFSLGVLLVASGSAAASSGVRGGATPSFALVGRLPAVANGGPTRGGYQPVRFNIPAKLPNAEAGKSYSYSFNGEATGGTGPPYNFAVKDIPTTYRHVRSALPAGIQLNRSSGTLHGNVSAKLGTYAFTVCASGRARSAYSPGNTSCASTKIVVVKAAPKPPPPPTPGFTLTADPADLLVTAGGANVPSTITVNPQNRFTGVVTFSTAAPIGFVVTFAPPSSAAGTTMSVGAALTAPLGTTVLTVSGTANGTTHTASVTLTVVAPPPAPDFSFTAFPATLNITVGGAAASSVITVTRNSSFFGAVSFLPSALPAGVTFTWGTATSTSITMIVTAGLTAKNGTTTLTITGTGGDNTHTTTVTLAVTGAPEVADFSGTWTGTYTGFLVFQGCSNFPTTGAITFQLTQTGSSVTGTVLWQGGTITLSATCALISRADTHATISATVSGTTLSGGGWNLQLSGTSLSGTDNGSWGSDTINVHR